MFQGVKKFQDQFRWENNHSGGLQNQKMVDFR